LNGREPDWLPWLEFFFLTLWRQVTGLARKIERLQSTQQSLSASERQLLDLVEQKGRLTIAMAVAETGANRETVRKRVAGLVAKGFLALDGKGRGAGYRKR
jgi:Fic family protein